MNKEYVIQNSSGMKATLSSFGARLVELMVPDSCGKLSNVVLGFDTHDEYLNNVNTYLGATIGRVAGRIADSRFRSHDLAIHLIGNENGNHLHGGVDSALDRVFWFGEVVEIGGSQSVNFCYFSPAGEAGYPGDLSIQVSYTLTNQNELIFSYRASASSHTPVNLTNHSYWNLHDSGATNILNHQLRINSDHIINMDRHLLPIGGYSSGLDSRMDFSTLKLIADALPKSPTEPWPGIDNTFMLKDKRIGDLTEAAILYDPISGRKMTITTTEPSLQVYTANRMGNLKGRSGIDYIQGNSICLEAQRVVDNPLLPELPTIVIKPGEEYLQKTIYAFSIE